MTELLSRYNRHVTVPIMIDSTEWPVMEASLRCLAGKPLLNSINFEDGEGRARKVLDLARRYGAGVVALTIDEVGMAKTAEQKVAIADRQVLRRGNAWIAIDDQRLHLHADEKVETRRVRFRTLGCWPLSGAIESDAENVAGVIDELRVARVSERIGRLVDAARHDSMERKKREGYF